MVGPDPGQPRWLVVIPHEQKELYERLRQSLKAGAPFHVILERRRGDRRRSGGRGPAADRRRSDRRQQHPVGALFTATIVRGDGLAPGGLAGGKSTVVTAACPACYAMVTFELPRFPKPPARLDAELVHTSGQHYAEIQAFTVSGRPLLVQRVQAFRRQSSS
jgi:hypothetical protein